ncbi:hypothetical protein GCM10008967_10280 [Bacillus carboniphilus]|uniref:histidine kinase n=1 Tax=Bacillus carboniphilus TaxID=86663 RepID=A0ABP3FN01_9BACI
MSKIDKDWHGIDWFIFFLRLFWYVNGLIYFYLEPEKLSGLPYTYFVAILTLCYVGPQVFWRPNYVNRTFYPVAELVLTGGSTIILSVFFHIHLTNSTILMSALMIGYLVTKKTSLWTIPTFAILIPTTRYWAMEKDLFDFFMQYIDVLIFCSIGLGFNLLMQSKKRTSRLLDENLQQYKLIQKQNQVLEQYAEQIEQVTLLEERNRMARDLHDTIGHHFTSVTVGLDAVSYLIDANPEKAKEKINTLARVAREGLDEIRNSIHQIAPSENDEPLSKHLHKITKVFSENTGTLTQFGLEGKEDLVSPQIRLTLVRCLQEAITNAKRHGNASEVNVLLQYREDVICLRIENNGEKMETIHPGFGLIAMQDRIEALRGTLEIKNNEGKGMVLTCMIPKVGSVNHG